MRHTGAAAQATDQLACPQVAANAMITDVADAAGLRTVDIPIHLDGETKRPARRAPGIGEHSRRVLGEFGFGQDEIEVLIESGAVAAG